MTTTPPARMLGHASQATPILRGLLAAIVALLLPIGLATSASADAFRFWGYYQWTDGEWAFAPTGPADTVPEEGAIEGWRFAVGGESATRFPRTGDVFDDICGAATASDGEKRVAVVLDYGTVEDAPDGEEPPEPRGDCAVVPEDASGADVLTAVAQVRLDEGLTCGIDGYPTSECGNAVDEAAPSGDEEHVTLVLPSAADTDTGGDAGDTDADEDDNQLLLLIAGVAAVVLVGVAAFVRARRSRGQ
nr:SCO2322 family protein [Phytoactinopolyspora mesophila]